MLTSNLRVKQQRQEEEDASGDARGKKMPVGVRLCCLFAHPCVFCAVNPSRSQVASQKVKCQHTDPLVQCIKNAFPGDVPNRIRQEKRKEIERAYVASIPDAKAKKDAQELLRWEGSQPCEQQTRLWPRASTGAREGKKA